MIFRIINFLDNQYFNYITEVLIATGNPRERPVPNVSTADLIMVCIDLVKDQVEILVSETRKLFFGNLINLVEKSPDPKVIYCLLYYEY